MCGDLDDDEALEEEFYARFVEHARIFLSKLVPPARPEEQDALYTYLDKLFRAALARAAEPDDAPDDVSGYDRLSMEPLVYARLAGFMAAHQPLDEDPLRRLIEALMTGYAEGEEMISERDREDVGHHGHTH